MSIEKGTQLHWDLARYLKDYTVISHAHDEVILDHKIVPAVKSMAEIAADIQSALNASHMSAGMNMNARQVGKSSLLGMGYGSGAMPQNLPRQAMVWQHGVVDGHVGVVLRLHLIGMGFTMEDIEQIDKRLRPMAYMNRQYRLYASKAVNPETRHRKFVILRADNSATRMRWLYDSRTDKWNMRFHPLKT